MLVRDFELEKMGNFSLPGLILSGLYLGVFRKV